MPALPREQTLPPLLKPPFSPRPPAALPPRPDAEDPFGAFEPSLAGQWTVSRHVAPAAWPRSYVRAAQSRSKPFERRHAGFGRGDRDLAAEEAELIHSYLEEAWIDIDDERTYVVQERLWQAVNRYRPRQASARRTRTLVLLQGTGSVMELAEPMLASLLASEAGKTIREVWTLDSVNQGGSATLNAGLLGDNACWLDSSRDIASFVLHSLPPAGTDDIATLLPDQPLNEPHLALLDHAGNVSGRRKNWRGHTLTGFGHSAGGAALALVLASVPLFDAFAVCDPMTIPDTQMPWMLPFAPPVGPTLMRRDCWKTKEAALRDFQGERSPSRDYADSVLQRLIEYGLKQDGDGYTLVTAKQDEAMNFGDRTEVVHAAANRLTSISPDLCSQSLLIEPREGGSWIFSEEHEQQVASLRGITTVQVDAAHMVPYEQPVETARVLSDWLLRLEEPRAKL